MKNDEQLRDRLDDMGFYLIPETFADFKAFVDEVRREAVEEALNRLPNIRMFTGIGKSESTADWKKHILAEMFPPAHDKR